MKREHKTDEGDFDRVIFFGPKSQAVLAPFMAGQADEAYVFRPMEGRMSAGNLGVYKPVKRGENRRTPREYYHYSSLENAVERACEKAGIAKFVPYSLRHSVFRKIQALYGRDGARVFGGHKVGGSTEIYCGSDLTLAAKIASEVG